MNDLGHENVNGNDNHKYNIQLTSSQLMIADCKIDSVERCKMMCYGPKKKKKPKHDGALRTELE